MMGEMAGETALWFLVALFLGCAVLLVIYEVSRWTAGLWKKVSILHVTLIAIIFISMWGMYDPFYLKYINPFYLKHVNSSEGNELTIKIVHWFGFWGAAATIVLFYFRTAYQGKQIDIQIRDKIDDRFHAAVTLLGNSETSARIGAVYSLYHLAIEDKKYCNSVAQILCSHIRSITQVKDKYQVENKTRPSKEIQIAIDLLFKDENGKKGLYKNKKISTILTFADLSHSYLVGANFKLAECPCMNLAAAKCQGAHFDEAQFQLANFEKASCQGANFIDAKCQCASFVQASCQGVDFNRAQLSGADFSKASCQGVHFYNAICQGVNFSEAGCQEATFTHAKCQGAYATEAALSVDSNSAEARKERVFNFSQLTNEKKHVLENLILSGELDDSSIASIKESKELLSEEWWDKMQDIIQKNKGKLINEDEVDNILRDDSLHILDMITGYLEKSPEIEKIIEELEKIAGIKLSK